MDLWAYINNLIDECNRSIDYIHENETNNEIVAMNDTDILISDLNDDIERFYDNYDAIRELTTGKNFMEDIQ